MTTDEIARKDERQPIASSKDLADEGLKDAWNFSTLYDEEHYEEFKICINKAQKPLLEENQKLREEHEAWIKRKDKMLLDAEEIIQKLREEIERLKKENLLMEAHYEVSPMKISEKISWGCKIKELEKKNKELKELQRLHYRAMREHVQECTFCKKCVNFLRKSDGSSSEKSIAEHKEFSTPSDRKKREG